MDSARPTLWSRSIVVMIVLVIVTLGFYPPIWYLRRRAALNALDSPVKLSAWPFVSILAFAVFALVISLAARGFAPEARSSVSVMLRLGQYGLAILMIVQSFRVKRILEDHLAGPGDTVVREVGQEPIMLSGLLTFFFALFYLQYVINHYVLEPHRSPAM